MMRMTPDRINERDFIHEEGYAPNLVGRGNRMTG